MVYLILEAAAVVASLVGLKLLFMWLAKDCRRIADEARAEGRNPDEIFLGSIARSQARQRRRFRSPYDYFGTKYALWAHRQTLKR